ncbi:hypothetical protein PEC730217_26680 [Pectobacterium carotovorum subsp. carotovorum]|nr:hypothetical protein PEC730217_26680 [Pectobacterium carotovorum subsp. carotovorum]
MGIITIISGVSKISCFSLQHCAHFVGKTLMFQIRYLIKMVSTAYLFTLWYKNNFN